MEKEKNETVRGSVVHCSSNDELRWQQNLIRHFTAQRSILFNPRFYIFEFLCHSEGSSYLISSQAISGPTPEQNNDVENAVCYEK